jgi:YidC/Oxa1 family membrane protein insertase
MTEQRNLIVALAISFLILLGFHFFYERPQMEQAHQRAVEFQKQQQNLPATPGGKSTDRPVQTPSTPMAPGAVVKPAGKESLSREAALALTTRIRIATPRVEGSIALVGGRIDDLLLINYRETLDPASPEIVLFSPAGAPHPYYAEFGWTTAPGVNIDLPGPATEWQADGRELTPEKPITLSWDNGKGLKFLRTISIDRDFMFQITQKIENRGGQPVTLYPYGLISRHTLPVLSGFLILHEGPLGVFRPDIGETGTLTEVDYDDVVEQKSIEQESVGGWAGITDKYWMTALIAPNEAPIRSHFTHGGTAGNDRYQTDMLGASIDIADGATGESSVKLFAGAKEVKLIDRYQDTLLIPRFDLAIDWGWLYFLTRPIFFVLDFFYRVIGNFGLAIILLTVVVKTLFLPLAYKSFVASNEMKRLQPEMARLKTVHGEDRQRMNQEMMELYKREKVNPASGCLPVLLQIPVFFALYKVLFTTIEMRHAPFYGWVQDLSARDPTTLFNLFGLLPWGPAASPFDWINIGIWPLLMGLSMFVQMRLSPQPADSTQARVMLLMPIMFTFLLARFPAGLVIYWTLSNTLSIIQQWLIKKKTGKKPVKA